MNTPNYSNDIFERVVDTLRSCIPKRSRTAEMQMETQLTDFGMDSLVFLEFLLALEAEFELNLTGDVLKLKQVLTVGDAVELVSNELTKVNI